MKRLLLLLVLFSAALYGKVAVAVSLPPQKYFAEKVGGELVEVLVMVPAGADPHTYAPRPRQMAELSRAELYFALGAPFEEAWLEKLAAQNRKMSVVDTGEGVARLPMVEEHDHGHHEHEEEHGHRHGTTDPHIWNAPLPVAIQAQNMAEALAKADPAHKETYRANYRAFLEELTGLDRQLATLFDGVRGPKSFLVFHPAWGYLADGYGLEEVAIESGGKEPGPRELARLIDRAREEKVRAVFIQPGFSKKTAQTIADALGARVVEADSLAEDWAANLLETAKKLAAAMGAR